MNRFKPGQEVVCIRPNGPYTRTYKFLGTSDTANGPKYNDTVTITGYDPSSPEPRVSLLEYSGINPMGGIDFYREVYFEPLVSDELLIEQLEQVAEPFTVCCDLLSTKEQR